MEGTNARTIEILEREHCSIEDTALNSCTEKNINLPTGKFYIIYRKMQINMLIEHR